MAYTLKYKLIVLGMLLILPVAPVNSADIGDNRLRQIFTGSTVTATTPITAKPIEPIIAQQSVATSEQATPIDAGIYLNFENTSLAGIVDYLAEQKKINVIPNKDVAAIKVSLRTRNPFTLEQAWGTMHTLLEMHGFSFVEVDNVGRIVPNKQNSQEPLPIYSSAQGVKPADLPSTDQVIRYIYFLHNIKAETALGILNKMLDTPIQYHPDLDVCIIKEKSLTIKSAMRIIEELDQGGLRQSIKMIPLRYTDPDRIDRIFRDEIIGQRGKEQERVRFVASSKKDVTYFSTSTKIIPYPERNAIFLLGQEKDLESYVHFITTYLDIPMEKAQSRLHVRDISYHEADKMRQLLQKALKRPSGTQGQDFKYFEDLLIMSESPSSGGYNSFSGGNRLIVACNTEDWARISDLIDQIDKPQPQVAFEVMVVNISLDMTRELGAHLRDTGVGVFGQDAAFRLANLYEVGSGAISDSLAEDSLQQELVGISGETGAAAATFGHITPGQKCTAWGVIKAILQQDNACILSQPFLVANNNEQCEFVSSEERRVLGEFVKSTYSTQQVRQKTGMTAKTSVSLTPRVNAAGVIDIGVEISVEDFKETEADQPETNSRTISTHVSMGVGEVLVLGGLTGSTQTETINQTPGLSAIPIIGNFFKSKSRGIDKKHLYIFVRPSIIKPQFEGRPDDYTQFKVDYAKHQIFKTESYSKSKDPIQRFFFKPRGASIEKTLDDVRAQRIHYVDDVIERKFLPQSADMQHDSYYRTQEAVSLASHKQPRETQTESENAHIKLKSRGNLASTS